MEWILIFLAIVAAWVLHELLSHILETLQEIQKDVEVIKDRLQRMEEKGIENGP